MNTTVYEPKTKPKPSLALPDSLKGITPLVKKVKPKQNWEWINYWLGKRKSFKKNHGIFNNPKPQVA